MQEKPKEKTESKIVKMPQNPQFIGRNKGCSCGSGKKFKNCCEPLSFKLKAKIKSLDNHILSEVKKVLVEGGIDHKDKSIILRSRKGDHTESTEIYYASGMFDILKVSFLSERTIKNREQMVKVINAEFEELVSFENLLDKNDGEFNEKS